MNKLYINSGGKITNIASSVNIRKFSDVPLLALSLLVKSMALHKVEGAPSFALCDTEVAEWSDFCIPLLLRLEPEKHKNYCISAACLFSQS